MTLVTTRLGLGTPESVDSMAAGAALLAGNYDKIDARIGCVITATLAAITDPYNGLLVFNEDDDKNYLRIGGIWQETDEAVVGNTALMGVTDSTTEVSFTAETKIMQVTFTAVAGRRYLVLFRCWT
jgi:hypothetical protein